MKKIIVFGSTGHLGAYTIDYLLDNIDKNEFEIIAVGRKNTDFYSNLGVDYFRVDVTDTEGFDILPTNDVYAVVNLVGIMPAAMNGYDPYSYINVNITGMLNVLEYSKNNNVNRIIFTQTEADLSGYWEENVVIKPDMPRNFSYKGNYSLYIISKCTAVDLIESYYQNYGLRRFIFRLPTVYHYRPDPYFYKNGVKTLLGYRQLINQAMAGEDIEMWGDPILAKDIVYVKDFAQMVYKALLANNDGGIYNVGTGQVVSLEDQIKGIIEVFSPEGRKSKIIPRPEKPNARSFIMDIENAKADLGYNPQFDYINYLKDFKKEMELDRFAELWAK
jgi:UDP-glucose 4-epimerase